MGCGAEKPENNEENETKIEQINAIIIDPDIDNEKNIKYLNDLKSSYNYLKLVKYKNADDVINYLKLIKFEETRIIINQKIYSEFIQKFKENIINLFVIPKIIIFANPENKK